MNQKVRESLSALMDGEGDELELRRVLKSLDAAPEEADTWRRYHLVRSAIGRERDIDVNADISAAVAARISEETAATEEETDNSAGRRGTPFSFVGSAAIAAAVSLMVITGVQVYRGGQGSDPGMSELATQRESRNWSPSRAGDGAEPAALNRSARSGAMTVGATPGWLTATDQPPQDERAQAKVLQSYLNRHVEQAGYHVSNSWMPVVQPAGGGRTASQP
ncbi:RseA-like anti sigma(E) protein [Kushneria sinocarnis]|uniref:RseA-like anti sigma(E) protein n=1 Tax=Kushneria sinocarnis TaxID=595502 RepID=A0A420WYL4_9GAMM|nr:sigma-E factor negative regulatory protein [Kushneria sinocarnis]RKR06324.1 RseA-like anti sigma(E) protein [Kushneria sinocarnis]